jgi:large subunit ribosomal protein L32e
MMPSGHKAFLVNNVNDVELLLMHNRTFAAEYVAPQASRTPTTIRHTDD